ncbi:uncharacterized protein BJ212DRAFT_1322887 [Suillus subaureus]|uniref:Secreted protein n=1 Tax=Suillus subaureus TaxID=48587 RepID=A0A9P7EM83_9AGAM|nr:uncharacterized protein BJ212DRAFT_1322887 [Suillus subaureus]KAG1824860.1 hypothetical protein BJ212DRAFT_1322887 [Suillus subaureus]
MCILGALGLSSLPPSSWCFQTKTTKRAGFISSSEPWFLPWRQEPLRQVQEVTHWCRGTLGGWAWYSSGSSTASSGSACVSTVIPAK